MRSVRTKRTGIELSIARFATQLRMRYVQNPVLSCGSPDICTEGPDRYVTVFVNGPWLALSHELLTRAPGDDECVALESEGIGVAAEGRPPIEHQSGSFDDLKLTDPAQTTNSHPPGCGLPPRASGSQKSAGGPN